MEDLEILEAKRDAFRKWMEQFSADECVKLLSDIYFMIEYKHIVESNLKGVHAN